MLPRAIISIVVRLTVAAPFLAAPAHSASGIQLADSKVWASGAHFVTPAWLDETRVLFLTGPGFRPGERGRTMAVWDLRNPPREYRRNVSQFCVRDAVVVYKAFDPNDDRLIRGTWYRGPIGEEKELRRDTVEDSARIIDPINCTVQGIAEQVRSAKERNRKIVPLLAGHGHLDLGPEYGSESTKNTPIRYVDAKGANARELPLKRHEVLMPREYYAFAGAYMLGNLAYGKAAQPHGKLGTKDLRLAWTLSPSGALVEHVVRDGRWAGGPVPFPYLTAKGIAFVNTSSASRAYGLYLSLPDKPLKLVGGFVSRVAVSPDGCRLAFSSAPDIDADRANAKNRRTFKVIDLCKG